MKMDGVSERLRNWKPQWSPTVYKSTLVGLVVSALVVPLGLVAVPFIEFFNDMAAQPKGKTQMSIGRVYGAEIIVERSPMEGTIPRGYVRYEYYDKGNTIEDAKEVGLRLANPLAMNMGTLRTGQGLYNVYCTVCHGKRGEGDGPVVGPDRFPAPPSMHTDQARQYKDGTVFHIITGGLGKMPGYADKLEPQDRWKVVHYLRALQRSMNPTPEDLTR